MDEKRILDKVNEYRRKHRRCCTCILSIKKHDDKKKYNYYFCQAKCCGYLYNYHPFCSLYYPAKVLNIKNSSEGEEE
jgi:hypothetical protein